MKKLNYYTTGELAIMFGVPRMRVAYGIERAHITEDHRVGIIRRFSNKQVPKIQAAVNAIRPRKESK